MRKSMNDTGASSCLADTPAISEENRRKLEQAEKSLKEMMNEILPFLKDKFSIEPANRDESWSSPGDETGCWIE